MIVHVVGEDVMMSGDSVVENGVECLLLPPPKWVILSLCVCLHTPIL